MSNRPPSYFLFGHLLVYQKLENPPLFIWDPPPFIWHMRVQGGKHKANNRQHIDRDRQIHYIQSHTETHKIIHSHIETQRHTHIHPQTNDRTAIQ